MRAPRIAPAVLALLLVTSCVEVASPPAPAVPVPVVVPPISPPAPVPPPAPAVPAPPQPPSDPDNARFGLPVRDARVRISGPEFQITLSLNKDAPATMLWQAYIDVDNDVTTGYGLGWEYVGIGPGIEPNGKPVMRETRTVGYTSPAGWGMISGPLDVKMSPKKIEAVAPLTALGRYGGPYAVQVAIFNGPRQVQVFNLTTQR